MATTSLDPTQLFEPAERCGEMWSFLLLFFFFYWTNDNIPRYKRGSRTFNVLVLSIAAFLAAFSAVHHNAAQIHESVRCPQQLDLSHWLRLSLALGVRASMAQGLRRRRWWCFDVGLTRLPHYHSDPAGLPFPRSRRR